MDCIKPAWINIQILNQVDRILASLNILPSVIVLHGYDGLFVADVAKLVAKDSHNSNPMVVHSASCMFVADISA